MSETSGAVGIIGGTGLATLTGLEITGTQTMQTPWGAPSSELTQGLLDGQPVVFLARHGNPHRIPPHEVNYRANLMALYDAGVRTVIGVNAVGGIHPDMGPACVVIPEQIIDYTWGRAGTFFEGDLEKVTHIDFTWPYDQNARDILMQAATAHDVAFAGFGVYGATQGPRLETAAEIRRMERDGCDLVGMTGMPEAALAAELGMRYVCLGLVVNRAAGKSDHVITMEEIEAAIEQGMSGVRRILEVSMTGLGALTTLPQPS
ncbi:MAG: S-methyl-5'-thioinosine phosphorylase [Marinobacter sp.]|uniref:S-methyl-5'-thioinosine phosphorylase n=1 Tax=Marinobacter sp. TaxID=50741 RepID=UPI001B528A07|nr:S-methyl-5'-thioinosine phosphorylase [Marinobacter sp.]MBQ0745826.1 S-methyl-5'-thioinosine phosphorylase [Marinobacter sp.]MBQ0813826.1 S-methyl-5'-thioinosine phosphorylase [Marinobacter sp.]|tara:strand:- start:5797 stop:6579 length:783 start_codon:yes stop_codon:yes gene_type:complete